MTAKVDFMGCKRPTVSDFKLLARCRKAATKLASELHSTASSSMSSGMGDNSGVWRPGGRDPLERRFRTKDGRGGGGSGFKPGDTTRTGCREVDGGTGSPVAVADDEVTDPKWLSMADRDARDVDVQPCPPMAFNMSSSSVSLGFIGSLLRFTRSLEVRSIMYSNSVKFSLPSCRGKQHRVKG